VLHDTSKRGGGIMTWVLEKERVWWKNKIKLMKPTFTFFLIYETTADNKKSLYLENLVGLSFCVYDRILI
jgi:hypothetical protein